MSRADSIAVETATQLYGELEVLLQELGQAVIHGDVARVSELVPQEEVLMRRISDIELPGSADREALLELQEVAARAMRQNTKNAILLTEQLQFIQETIRALVGDRNAVDRLA